MRRGDDGPRKIGRDRVEKRRVERGEQPTPQAKSRRYGDHSGQVEECESTPIQGLGLAMEEEDKGQEPKSPTPVFTQCKPFRRHERQLSASQDTGLEEAGGGFSGPRILEWN